MPHYFKIPKASNGEKNTSSNGSAIDSNLCACTQIIMSSIEAPTKVQQGRQAAARTARQWVLAVRGILPFTLLGFSVHSTSVPACLQHTKQMHKWEALATYLSLAATHKTNAQMRSSRHLSTTSNSTTQNRSTSWWQILLKYYIHEFSLNVMHFLCLSKYWQHFWLVIWIHTGLRVNYSHPTPSSSSSADAILPHKDQW